MRRQRYLATLATLLLRWPKLFLLAGIGLAGVGAVYTVTGLDFKTSRNDLIGRDSEYWRNYSAYAREFGAEEDYLVVVESDRPDRNRAAIEALAAALVAPGNNPHPADPPRAQSFRASDLFYRVDYAALKPWFLYYLTPAELRQIRDSLGDFQQLVGILQQNPRLATFFEAMTQMVQQMAAAPPERRAQMEAFLPTITGLLRQLAAAPPADDQAWLSPWASAFFSAEMLREAEHQMQWHGYQVFKQGAMFVLLVHPRVPAGATAEALHSDNIPKLQRILTAVQAEFPEVRINLTGEPVLDYDEMLWSQRDATRATVITLVLIGVIFGVGFRELLRPLLGVLCMLLVLAASMGWATFAVGHLNIITVTFTVMLLGLGIDLSIQLIARFEEELSRGLERPAAIVRALEETGASLITAGLTNAAAFFAMGLSGFRGVIELGIIAGGGLILATALTLIVLPALLALVHRRTESTHIPAQVAATRVERYMLRHPGLVLAICLVMTGVGASSGWRVRYDYNVLNLQTKNLPSVETELRLLRADAESTIYGAVVCDTLEETRRVHHSLTGLASVVSVHSIAELLPADFDLKAPIVREIQAQLGTGQFARLATAPELETVRAALGALRLRAAAAARETGLAALAQLAEAAKVARETLEPARVAEFERQFFSGLEDQLGLMAAQVTDRPMTIEDMPANLRQMLVGKTGKFLVRVFPKENVWERAPLERFVRDLQAVAPQVTGTPVGLYEFVAILQRGYVHAALWALLVIALIILVDFRHVTATLLTLLPLVVGMIWMVGLMGWFAIPFNPANIMTLPLMVGIGVAYGIYVVQRFRREGEAAFYGKSTGRAVLLSALTTIAAFVCLSFASHRGIQSLGVVMTMGVAACLISSMVMLPALLEIAKRRGWKL
jgi:hypothetical protein